MKSHRMATLVAVLAGLVLAALPAAAQNREDVEIVLERTDQVIARAEMLVSGSEDTRAQLELAAAVRLQAEARVELSAGRFVRALDLTRRARLHADRAIAIVSSLPDPDRVLVQLERTRELLDRARDRIEECGLDRARALFRAAVEMQARAEVAARESRYLLALQLTTSARERALRALRLCNLEDNLRDAAERALARTDEIVSRARDRVTDSANEAAAQALARAVELQAEAWVQFRAGHFEASLRLTQSARTFAHRAMRLAEGR